jgi:membrane-associated protein
VVFTETGLLIGFCLPGDSLLFTCGMACVPGNALTGEHHLDLLTLNLWLIPAAIIGDTVGYWIGYKAGAALYKREKTWFFRPKHLQATREFYERHGGKTIVLARFVPIIRTFAPVVAGIGQMPYKRFVAYNVFGGIFWVVSLTVAGFYLGGVEWIKNHIEATIMLVIFISILPAIISVVHAKYFAKETPANVIVPVETVAEASKINQAPTAPAVQVNVQVVVVNTKSSSDPAAPANDSAAKP